MNTSRIYFLVLLFVGSCVADAYAQTIASPDGNLEAHFRVDENQGPVYHVSAGDEQVLATSQLGLVRDGIDFSQNIRLQSSSDVQFVEEHYSMLHGKQRAITYQANECMFLLEHVSGKLMVIRFRVSNDGVAFRYQFPGREEGVHHITEEKTTFHLPQGSRGWLEPLANVNTGFANTNPSYEEYYKKDVPAGTAAPDSAGWAYPALFKLGEQDRWVLISETGLDGSYPATRLQQEAPDGIYQIGFPQEGEQYPGRALDPTSTLPWSTPWRFIAVGTLETIAKSTLGTDLARPAVSPDTTWINPGRASWSWAKLKDESVNYETQKAFIDYAADMGWEYTLVDVNWNETIGYDRIEELATYAAEKGVGLILWYNSSGSWNTTTYTPKSKLLTHKKRVKEFSRLQEMGIKGIKVDFFAGDGQSMMQYYQDIFTDAARYNLLVNTHGTTLPRGWHRTYPNLMTMESVKGFEYITFEQGNADEEAVHSTILPFTRNVFSPMDFTPMSLTKLTNVKRKTTTAFQLALPILFTSGIQHYAETAEGMQQVAPYLKDVAMDIPVRWDEMKLVHGFPGKEVVIARRSESQWYIAGINGEQEEKTLTLDLSFLSPEINANLITDAGDTLYDTEQSRSAIETDQPFTVTMKGNGGFVLVTNEK